MKYIINGGVTSKNVTKSTKEALTLAKINPNIRGIAIDIKLTKDNEVAVVANETYDPSNYTLDDYLKQNVGTKVQKSHPISLYTALDVFTDSNQLVVLNMLDEKTSNNIFIEKVIDIVKNYPNINIYIKSKSKDIVLGLNKHSTKARIGLTITDEISKRLKINVDFYSMNKEIITIRYVIEKLIDNYIVMVENIKNRLELIELYELLDDVINEVFIITDNPSLISIKNIEDLGN